MKRIAFFLICFIPFLLSAQNNRGHGNEDPKDKNRERIERLEKIKLIELLDLKEDIAIKFFARRNELYNKLGKLGEDKAALIDNLEKELKSDKKLSRNYFNAQIKKISNIDIERAQQKQNYYYSLNSYLTTEQIAKYMVFEVRFREEMWREMMKDNSPKK